MGRSHSYTPSPPRGGGYGRRRRSPSPRGRYGGRDRERDRDGPTSLLVRNLRRDCRTEDLRRPFKRFGRLKDVYMPLDYYTKEPRGFAFVQYLDPADAADAKHYMDRSIFLGRELTVVFAEENRKKPEQMRARERERRHRSRSRSSGSYSPPPRQKSNSRDGGRDSFSPPPRRHRSRSRSSSPHSPPPRRRSNSRSASPDGRKDVKKPSSPRSPSFIL